MKISLVDFIRSGAVGGIELGESRAAVVQAWGKPYGTSVSVEPEILVYGFIQLTFRRGHLDVIVWTVPIAPSDKFELQDWVPDLTVDVARFSKKMHELNVRVAVDSPLTFGTQQTLMVGDAGVRALFMEEVLSKVYRGE